MLLEGKTAIYPSLKMNGLRTSDLRLQDADPEYVTRAGSNNVHFLLSLHDVNTDPLSYVLSCLKEGEEINIDFMMQEADSIIISYPRKNTIWKKNLNEYMRWYSTFPGYFKIDGRSIYAENEIDQEAYYRSY